MKALLIIAIVLAALFLLTILIYWFNLDTKAVHALQNAMTKHYDSIKRDKKI